MEPIAINLIADTTTLLSYITNLCLTFIIAIAGAFTREVYSYKRNNNRISVFRLIASALLCSVVMTAVAEYADIKFGIFVLITYFFGMWAFSVIDILMNAKYIAIAIKDVFKELKNPLLKGTANAIEDIRKEIKEENKEKEKKDKEAKEKEESKAKEKEEEKETPVQKEVIPELPQLTPEEDKKLLDQELLRQIRKLEKRVAAEVERER